MTIEKASALHLGSTPFPQGLEQGLKALMYHGHSLWLFTASDIKTMIAPSFLFGIFNAAAAPRYGIAPLSWELKDVAFQRVLFSLLWIWINLLPLVINNQKAPDAIEEDKSNKPWRPLPSGRMTSEQATRLMFILYCATIAWSIRVGGFRQSVGLIVLGSWYNNFGGGDVNPCLRNVINACGYICFTSGAMEVVLGSPLPQTSKLLGWLGMIIAIISTTVHVQDMHDQEGDQARGRRTMPLVIGDANSRWAAAIPLLFWGLACAWYWDGGIVVYMASIILAGSTAARTLLLRSVESDKQTWKFWLAWMTLVFSLPYWTLEVAAAG